MITGCFLFQNSRLLPLIKRALTKVLLPTLLLFMLCLAISGWHLPVKYFDHTWYVFVYLTVIILFPLLKPFAGFLDRGKGRDLAFLCISLLLFLLNDLMENRLLFFGFTPLTGFLPAAAEILWGHILYRRVRTGRILAPVLLFFYPESGADLRPVAPLFYRQRSQPPRLVLCLRNPLRRLHPLLRPADFRTLFRRGTTGAKTPNTTSAFPESSALPPPTPSASICCTRCWPVPPPP